MPLSAADKLRLLNLAYRQMQQDFKHILPELFRGNAQSLTSDASGYIYLPTNSFEVENIVIAATQVPLERIDKKLRYRLTGYYHDGVEQSAGANLGKRRIMIRSAGVAYATLAVTVDLLIEYPDLAAITDTPHPFVQSRYLNMLTELQTFMMLMEGGKESASEAERHWNVYQFLLGQVKKDALDNQPQFMTLAANDAGDGWNLPMTIN